MKPILIYQMGKVGSTTVKHTLDFYSIPNYQIHYLDENTLAKIEEVHEEKGLKVPLHIHRSREVREKQLVKSDDLRVISLVRDPVSRNVSAFFQNINAYYSEKELETIKVEDLIATFMSEYPHHISINWFDKELKSALGIDVCDIANNKSQAYFQHKEGNVQFLLIKVEASNAEKMEAMGRFLELPADFELVSGNIGDDKSYSDIYRKFKDKIKFPDSYLEEMYGSRLITSLYDESEISIMRSRWTLN